MSANDYILIKKVKKGYTITHRDADTEHVISNIGKASDIKSAISLANAWQEDSMILVEYGIRFNLKGGENG